MFVHSGLVRDAGAPKNRAHMYRRKPIEFIMSGEGETPKEVAEGVACVKLENGDVKSDKAEAKGDAGPTFTEQFRAFSKFGDIKSDGRTITLSQSDKWMKQAKVIDGKTIMATDTGIYFKKLKSLKVSITDYNKFLEDLAKAKKVEVKDLKQKMTSCGAPGHSSATAKCSANDIVSRLTDTSKYTGSHKQRFDETGKGKGISGRKDVPDGSGYVSGYANKDTYDKKADA